MARTRMRSHLLAVLAQAAILSAGAVVVAENVDPDGDGSQYAWAENAGWINAQPLGTLGDGAHVYDFELSGWLWGENIGWISLSCENTASCGTFVYGVANDGHGVLTGYAWGENPGWISLSCENTSSCSAVSYGVTIDPVTGDWSGSAWGENVGWVTFKDDAPVGYKVRTGWCLTTAGPPAGIPTLSVGKLGGDTLLSWPPLPDTTWYELVRGSLGSLRGSGGDFAATTEECLADDLVATSLLFSGGAPATGEAFWFLLRGANCKGEGNFDSGGPSQVGLRDVEIEASAGACP